MITTIFSIVQGDVASAASWSIDLGMYSSLRRYPRFRGFLFFETPFLIKGPNSGVFPVIMVLGEQKN
jgi:hypothetical protein